MVKKKAIKPKKIVKKAVPNEILIMQTQISNILTLVKELTEVVESQNKIVNKIKGRMGL